MAFLKFFKGKKAKPQKKTEKERKKEVKKAVELPKRAAKKEPEIAKPQPAKTRKQDVKTAPYVLKQPQITEKATLLQEKNQYVFQVFFSATKPEVKKSVEEVYGVNVEKVRMVNVPRKRKRLGGSSGWKSGYKKAIVTLRAGQEIEILPR